MLLSWFLILSHSTNSAFVIPSPFSASKQQQVQSQTPLPLSIEHTYNKYTLATPFHLTPAPTKSSSQFNRRRQSPLYASDTQQPQPAYDDECDVLILGSGPAARAIATLLSCPSQNLNILLADSNYDRQWAPNYGLWRDEWNAISDRYLRDFKRVLGDECIDREWAVTDGYFGGSFDIPIEQRLRIDRPYVRVDKEQLRAALSPPEQSSEGDDGEGSYRVLKASHRSEATSVNVYAPSGSLVHDAEGSTIQLHPSDDNTPLSIRAKIIVDCTGHETNLVLPDTRSATPPPGYQIAYGALVTVDESNSPDPTHIGPYDKQSMTLFDYRTDHFDNDQDDPKSLQRATTTPTFMYAMPLEGNRIFFEETSLVARPAVSFAECKERCFRRLEHLGVQVTGVEEEEYCYIPMGGPLPMKDQRIVGFGGASAMVHPSTGFSLARVMMGATDVCTAIHRGLDASSSGPLPPDQIAAGAYQAMWTPEDIAQRNFAVFGGEFLMEQDVKGLRGFFDGFFRISEERWGGFLAGRPGLPNNNRHDSWLERMVFGLVFIARIPLPVAVGMFLEIVKSSLGAIDLPQSVTPLFGDPDGYGFVERPAERGDVAAKSEARRMIKESEVEEEVPDAFFRG